MLNSAVIKRKAELAADTYICAVGEPSSLVHVLVGEAACMLVVSIGQ